MSCRSYKRRCLYQCMPPKMQDGALFQQEPWQCLLLAHMLMPYMLWIRLLPRQTIGNLLRPPQQSYARTYGGHGGVLFRHIGKLRQVAEAPVCHDTCTSDEFWLWYCT